MKFVAIGAIVVGMFSGAALAQDVSPEPLIDNPQFTGTSDQPANLNTVVRGTKSGPVRKGPVRKFSVTTSVGVLGPGQLSPPTEFERGGARSPGK
jgi:hypothetical protein